MKFLNRFLLILLIVFLLSYMYKKDFFFNILDQELIKLSVYTENVLKEVYLSGRKNENKVNIIDAINVSVGDPLSKINIEEIRKNLNKLSWVKDSSVYLLPMGQLEIKIREYRPFSRYIDENDDIYLINKKGTKFKKISDIEFENIFKLYGVDALLKVNELPLIIKKLKTFNFEISSIERIDSRRWNIYLNKGFFIKLPSNNAVSILDALYNLDNNIDYNNLTFIDLRILDRVSLKYKQVD